jgi:vancomycin permeability regulator SanA
MDIFVIMGAAVMADGRPSGAMRRRVEGALDLARKSQDAFYIVTGGKGRYGPPEAEVMKFELQASGVPEDRIVPETVSKDSLSSVENCARIIKKYADVESVFVCSDRYHIPRCRWLFWMLGISTRPGHMPSGLKANGILRWSIYYFREIIATPVDTLLMLGHRLARPGQ